MGLETNEKNNRLGDEREYFLDELVTFLLYLSISPSSLCVCSILLSSTRINFDVRYLLIVDTRADT